MFRAAVAHDLEPDVTLPWLIRLRWLALAGQVGALAIGWQLGLTLHWGLLFAAVALGAASNVALVLGVERLRRTLPPGAIMGGVLVTDVALLTLLLAASGGATNPFTVLYLVHITLSAVVLSARWILAIAALAAGGFGLLFALPLLAGGAAPGGGAHAHHHAAPTTFDHHLQGMWIAFVLATVLTAFFVRRITLAIASQREQIAALRESSARNARLAALTTLAAGAAHELGSPLGTIAVAVHEAELALAGGRPPTALADDLRLIQLEVDRCQHILHQMGARAGEDADADAAPVALAALIDEVRERLGKEPAARVALRASGDRAEVRAPVEPLVQSIVALIKNALDASPPGAPVAVEFAAAADGLVVDVRDHGAGIAASDLARVGEPFFTTKQPGRGLGLGVFLARAFLESRGGGLTIESTAGIGTRAIVRMPA